MRISIINDGRFERNNFETDTSQPRIANRRNKGRIFPSRRKTEVSDNPVKPLAETYREKVQTVDDQYVPPRYDTMHRSLSRARSKLLPAVPKTPANVSITGTWAFTSTGKQFLLQEQNSVIFCTDQGFKHLVRSNFLLGDGTFNTAPAPFKKYTL